MDDFAGANGNGPAEDRTIEDKSVKFAVFATGIGVRRKITEKGIVEFAPGETGGEDFRIDAGGDGAETIGLKFANQLAGVALPDGKESGHVDAGEVFLAVNAKIFEKNVAKGNSANALIAKDAQCMFHARFVNEIDALRRDENFVQGQADGFGLLKQEFATDAVHADAGVTFGDGGEKRSHAEFLLKQRVQRHGAVFAAAPAEKDGFGRSHECVQKLNLRYC